MTQDDVCTQYYCRILAYTRKHLREQGEDACQMTFLKLCRAWTPEQETWSEAQMVCWLYEIARNTCIDMKRSGDTLCTDELEADTATTDLSTEQRVEQRILFLHAFSRLCTTQQTVLRYAGQGYSYEEVGKREHMKPRTVACRLNRARITLKKEYAKEIA